jgi:hypothetical protein
MAKHWGGIGLSAIGVLLALALITTNLYYRCFVYIVFGKRQHQKAVA